MNPPIMRISCLWTWATGGPPPRTHRLAYRRFEYDDEIWAWPGLHLVLRGIWWWQMHRWAAEWWGQRRRHLTQIGVQYGTRWFVFVCSPGDYYSNGHWVIRHV
jgi:hypothetical protein